MNEEKEELNQYIERIYEIFSSYYPEATLTLCPCCSTREEQIKLSRIVQTPLRSLSDSDFLIYESALSINSGVYLHAIKYAIPLYMESILSVESSICLYQDSLSFLKGIEKKDWKERELEIIESSLLFFLGYYLNTHPHEVFENISQLNIIDIIMLFEYFDVQKALDVWLNHTSYTALLHLKDLIYLRGTENNKRLNKWLKDEKVRKVFCKKIENLILFENQKASEDDLEELNFFMKFYW